ncbi:demethylmenaquinone methyltransferase-like [Oculina patagonica]
MNSSTTKTATEGYKQSSLPVQNKSGKTFIRTDLNPQAGDTILDLGCGTGELSAYMAELVGPKGKVVGVDPDKERLQLARQSYGEIKNLSFVEGSSLQFPGIGSESYDIIFSNYVIQWIPDKEVAFQNMYRSLKTDGKVAAQYVSYLYPFMMSAFKELNPEKSGHIIGMFSFEERAKVDEYCSAAGFHIISSYDTEIAQFVFESTESLLKWLWSTTHGLFDPDLVTEERLQRYYPYSSREGQPPFDFRGIKEESTVCRLVAVKQV